MRPSLAREAIRVAAYRDRPDGAVEFLGYFYADSAPEGARVERLDCAIRAERALALLAATPGAEPVGWWAGQHETRVDLRDGRCIVAFAHRAEIVSARAARADDGAARALARGL